MWDPVLLERRQQMRDKAVRMAIAFLASMMYKFILRSNVRVSSDDLNKLNALRRNDYSLFGELKEW